jgi:prolyl oligopeptidase
VKDGFSLPEAKMSLDWRDKDTLFVATDFGAGSLTDSGYARIVKVWKRGTPISAAKLFWKVKNRHGCLSAKYAAWRNSTQSGSSSDHFLYRRKFFT